jgi:hypothetical protein
MVFSFDACEADPDLEALPLSGAAMCICSEKRGWVIIGVTTKQQSNKPQLPLVHTNFKVCMILMCLGIV